MTDALRFPPARAVIGALALLASALLGQPASGGVDQPRLERSGNDWLAGRWSGGTEKNAMGPPDDEPAPTEEAPTPSVPQPASDDYLCPAEQRDYRKSLLITSFGRRRQASNNAGRLWHAERELPALVGAALADSGRVFRYQLLERSLPLRSRGASAQRVRELAREHRTQLVLSGELEDMGMARPRDAIDPGWLTRTRNAAVSSVGLSDWDTRQRQFALTLRLREGPTGRTVFERRFQVRAIWNPEQAGRARFGSPDFWETEYGEKIAALVERAATSVAEAIRCQPLVARLDTGGTATAPILHAGRAQGLAEGDRLPLHRLDYRSIAGEYRQYRAQLLDSGVRLTVERVHEHYSEVRLEGSPKLYREHLAVTPAPSPAISAR